MVRLVYVHLYIYKHSQLLTYLFFFFINCIGKSAIVAAIQLCLGGSARTTGRGSSIGALVREGSNGPAILTVTLRNEGEDAFEPAKYGKRIHVRRKIQSRGNSEYALLGEPEPRGYKDSDNGKGFRAPVSIVMVEGNSTAAKDVLEKLTQQFNICVPNPCCILTQEESKKFINGQDRDKYDFFLKVCQCMYMIT